MMRPASEGGLAELFDVMPPPVLREALMVVISCRPINLIEEAERSSRLSGASARGLLGRVLLLNSTQRDLVPLFQLADASTRNLLQHRSEQRRPGTTVEPRPTPARRRAPTTSTAPESRRSKPRDGEAGS